MSADETLLWENVLEHYHHDRLAEAWELAQSQGVGTDAGYLRWYRVIEAEAQTRIRGTRVQVTPWLTLEYVPDDILDLEDLVIQRTVETCNRIGKLLGWDHSAPTLVSILAKECDAPWAVNPFGYCTDKYEFDKICLPDYLVDDEAEFRQAVAHEYAHVASLNLSNGYAPRWLEEAISVLTEGDLDQGVLEDFRQDPETWLSPDDLEMAFFIEEDPEDASEAEDIVWRAYQQAGVIGHLLHDRGSGLQLGQLLRLHAEEQPWRNLWHTAIGRSRTDHALLTCFGMDTEKLFREAYQTLTAKG